MILVKQKVKPEAIQKVKDAYLRCKEQTVKEPGCLKYEKYQSFEDSTVFFMVEIWADQAAYDYHMQTPYLKQLLEDSKGTNQEGFKSEFIKQPLNRKR